MPNTISVKFNSHFKRRIPVSDVLLFEKELSQRGVVFYADKRSAFLFNEAVLYYFLDKDSGAVHQILADKQYALNSEVVVTDGFSEERKMIHLYLKCAFLFILLTMVLKGVGAFVTP